MVLSLRHARKVPVAGEGGLLTGFRGCEVDVFGGHYPAYHTNSEGISQRVQGPE